MVAGAADNDPTSVATLSVIGSTTLFGLLWLLLLILPLLLAIQVISSRVGLISGRNLQRVIRSRFGRAWAGVSLVFVVVVDVVTIAADLAGGAAAVGLLVQADWRIFVLPLALFNAVVLLVGRYRVLQRYLRFVLFVFAAYIGAGLLARPNWGEVLRATFVPVFALTRDYVAGALALLGTTLTSYVYFWETIEEEEERLPREQLGAVQLDAAIGIVFTTTIFWFILVSAAATAGTAGMRIQTAEDAALALMPIAGPFAAALFAIGLLASSLLAVPVLAATTAYVVIGASGGEGTVDQPLHRGNVKFYLVIALSLAAGTLLSLLGVPPIALLFTASIVGGLGTPLLLVLLLRAASDEAVMGKYQVKGLLQLIGLLAVLITSIASALYAAFEVADVFR